MRHGHRIKAFVETIWDWYSTHKRILPWRDLAIEDETERGYRILVSEVMLQQTQVSRVIVIYKRFLDQFPTLEDLATASNKDVILAWRGMGYNSRALRLRDAAKKIMQNPVGPKYFGPTGFFPKEMHELLSIPGIGRYTAGAIRNFAFHLPTPCIDTNIRRILHRTFFGPENPDGRWKMDDKALLKLAGEVLNVAVQPPPRPSGTPPPCTGEGTGGGGRSPADWHAALMDFGSLVQTKSCPKWEICPLTQKGIMVTNRNSFEKAQSSRLRQGCGGQAKLKTQSSREPGRLVGSTFIPNRIFRGKIVEELRDAKRGVAFTDLGKRICIDWDTKEHRAWLRDILKKLQRDEMIEERAGRYLLAS
ncbi:hypothetical protein HYZ99_05865 [Candidatus Peregrinibacteria bacterium]|nr:hypothetical protein [Candidatus Peregrinibacteria bacterium]